MFSLYPRDFFLSCPHLSVSLQAAVCTGSGPAESCSSQLGSSPTAAAAPTADQPDSAAVPGPEVKVGTVFNHMASEMHVQLGQVTVTINVSTVFVSSEHPRASYLLLLAPSLYQILVLSGKCRTLHLRHPAHRTSSRLLHVVSSTLDVS